MSDLLPHASQRPVVWHLMDLMEERTRRTLRRCFPWLIHDEAPNGCDECEYRDSCRRRLAPEGADIIAWLVSDMKAAVGRQATNGCLHSRRRYRKLTFDGLKDAVFAFLLPECRRNRWVGFIINSGHAAGDDLIQDAALRVQSRLFRQSFEAPELFWGWFKNMCVWVKGDQDRRDARIQRIKRRRERELSRARRHVAANARRADRERDQNDIRLEALTHAVNRLSDDHRRFFLAYSQAPSTQKSEVAATFGMTTHPASEKYRKLKIKVRKMCLQYLIAKGSEDLLR